MEKIYIEDVTCRVIDMDDIYVLFGRPWNGNVNGRYCENNTYLFEWESHKIKIKPIKKIVKNDPPKVCEKKSDEVSFPIEQKIKDEEADLFIEWVNLYGEDIFEYKDQHVVNYE